MRLTLPRGGWRPALLAIGHAVGTRRVALGISALLMPSLVAAAVLVPAHASKSHRDHAAALTIVIPTPSTTPSIFIDPALFAAARKRAAATAPLPRLPQVDLTGIHASGIPLAALRAYVTAARTVDRADPGCHLRWWLLAGIGYVESQHAFSGGSARPHWNGIAHPAIYGPVLDGSGGFAAIRDTDRGRLDGNRSWDRAVGPMQFLPSTWRSWGADPRGRLRDPQDIRAAALAAAGYLCAGSADLSAPQGMAAAVYSYNHSFDYVRLVLSVAARYAGVDPNSLGVNQLPHDHPAHKKKAKAKPKPSSSPHASASASAPPQSATSTASPQPSATATATSAPAPAPSGPSLPPLPSPGAFG